MKISLEIMDWKTSVQLVETPDHSFTCEKMWQTKYKPRRKQSRLRKVADSEGIQKVKWKHDVSLRIAWKRLQVNQQIRTLAIQVI